MAGRFARARSHPRQLRATVAYPGGALSRTRKQLTREIVQHTNRIQKTLEDANIKRASAISNVLGMSGRAILEVIIRGESDPEKLVELCRGRLKATRKELLEALRGRVTAHHRFLLKLHLAQVDHLSQGMRDLEARMGELLAPFREQVENLTTIPGVSDTTARVLAGEIGLDMNGFPSASHLIRDGVTYRDLGADHFSKRNPEQTAKRLIKRLEGLGFAIEARPTTAFVSI